MVKILVKIKIFERELFVWNHLKTAFKNFYFIADLYKTGYNVDIKKEQGETRCEKLE